MINSVNMFCVKIDNAVWWDNFLRLQHFILKIIISKNCLTKSAALPVLCLSLCQVLSQGGRRRSRIQVHSDSASHYASELMASVKGRHGHVQVPRAPGPS
jgi:hypothetical protein